ncbi:aromatic ring-hydroxylating oxygenase subunit alpha [Mycolicibacterium moriokaense]|uniref:(2Fe-2S)-binding protein n=1 Tax=Mycolicibacterium moriokaense TaxID=39691 RepID=A0AAD1HFW2_9MYCO|nr:aromatic ring-hydroxylating dioxygenase subunit alpha [Mycolicibacterium moriokaense]MCV7041955.1 aromatic ring-hydroxylating dioxygenase subunit alpha [Mycolicibacterium moriokaense]BBX04722.1 (2Fe-2S)-binding protein [Mycolicibacterium moriokaense]
MSPDSPADTARDPDRADPSWARKAARAHARIEAMLDLDRGVVPEQLRTTSFTTQRKEPLEVERYVSRQWHDLEVDKVWKRVWQVACREEEIPEQGDSVIYEIASMSLIVVRTQSGAIRAFHNTCLHRGRRLLDKSTCVSALRCQFHGFTWSLDGELISVPSRWDFDDAELCRMALPEAKVSTWEGWVFIAMDEDAPPLTEYLGGFIDHWKPWPMSARRISRHIVKHLKCNWKVALDAFIESYHVIATHPQLLFNLDDVNTQYDIYPGEDHFNRMITLQGVSSPHLGEPIGEHEILASLLNSDGQPAIAEGRRAREVLADIVRRDYSRTAQREIDVSDSEAIDAIQYYVFPNFVPWGGLSPIVYRFRPLGDRPDRSVMDVYLMAPRPEGQPIAKPGSPDVLDFDDAFSSLPNFGRLGLIFDQDMANLGEVQRGLLGSVRPNLVLAGYQESRIRHYMTTMDKYFGFHPSETAPEASCTNSRRTE